MFPDYKEFRSLSEEANIIPVYDEIVADLDTPVSAYLKLNSTPSFLLESVEGGERWGRYSFICSEPSLIISSKGKKVEIIKKGKKERFITGDPIDYLRLFLSRFRVARIEGLPRFFGGLVGYIGYDMVRFFERVPEREKPFIDIPEMYFMFTDNLLIFDNLRHRIKILCLAHVDSSPDTTYKRAIKKIEMIKKSLSRRISLTEFNRDMGLKEKDRAFNSNFKKEDFITAVKRAKEYVMSGDVVQVVLSQRFSTRTSARPFDIYRALRLINPSPYMYYINTGDVILAGSSPEILVRLEGDNITLRPIAGTRRRGLSFEEDKALEKELFNDPKERAEHIMLVDLGRNDVGRVAETGSVRVNELMTVERYSHVMHLVSNVEGRLRKGMDAFDVLKACFPAGTVTGAPKVRAMEIIDELEPTRRGPYAGAVGYFSLNGNMDTCITIRTLMIHKGRVYVQSGAGIVADSDEEREYQETVNKAMAMMKAVMMAED